MMNIAKLDEIPKAEKIVDTPIDDLLSVYKVCQEMDEVCTNEEGIGLSAVQVGIPWRLFILKNSSGNFESFVNCRYEPVVSEGKSASVEGCLSLKPNGKLRRFRLERWNKIRLVGHVLFVDHKGKLNLKKIDYETQPDIYNIVYQHEIDHQKGILISDLGEEIEVSNE